MPLYKTLYKTRQFETGNLSKSENGNGNGNGTWKMESALLRIVVEELLAYKGYLTASLYYTQQHRFHFPFSISISISISILHFQCVAL